MVVIVLVNVRSNALKVESNPLEMQQLVGPQEVAEGEQDLRPRQRALDALGPLVDEPLHLCDVGFCERPI